MRRTGPAKARLIHARRRRTVVAQAPGIARDIRISPGAPCSCRAAHRASARRSSRAFAAQGAASRSSTSTRPPARSSRCAASSAPRVRYWRCDVRDIAALRAAIAAAAAALRPDPRAGQQRGARRSPALADVTPEYWDDNQADEPASSFVRRAGGRARHGGGRRRLDHQPGLGVVDARPAGSSPATRRRRPRSTGSRARSRASSGRMNIRVNSIVPGAIVTERQQRAVAVAREGAGVPRAAVPQVPPRRGRRRARRAVPRVGRGARHHRPESGRRCRPRADSVA